jgi:hypothetical protein
MRPSRLIVTLSLGLIAGGAPLVGCHKRPADKGEQAGPSSDSVKQAFEALKKQSDDLEQSFSRLTKDVEAIPADLRGYPQLRTRFYEAEEARGVTNAKVTMLAGRLESALRSGKRDELQQLWNEIAKSSGDVRQIGEIYIKLLHQVLAFQRVADERKEALAASSATPSSAKIKKPKPKL